MPDRFNLSGGDDDVRLDEHPDPCHAQRTEPGEPGLRTARNRVESTGKILQVVLGNDRVVNACCQVHAFSKLS